MKNLVIIGNSGAARECYWLARECIAAGAPFAFRGFLSFEGYPGNLRDLSEFQICSDDDYSPEPDDIFAIGIGLPELRERVYTKWKERGAVFASLIHPSVRLIGDVRMGEANILACNTYISCNSVIGDANYFNGSVTLGHDASIGSFNFLAPFSMVLGGGKVGDANNLGVYSVLLPNARIGSRNTVAPGACVYKGCGDGAVMAGNPALNMNAAKDGESA